MPIVPYPSLADAYQRPEINDSVRLHRFKWGQSYWIQDDPRSKLFKDLRNSKKPYQKYNLACLRYLLGGRARHIIDVGMNIGMMSVNYAHFCDHITGFDAGPDMLSLAVKNLVINRADHKVTPHLQALGSSSSLQYYYQMKNNGAISGIAYSTPEKRLEQTEKAILKGNKPKEYKSILIPVQIEPLDAFELNDVDAVKIDVEGYEYEVVKGATKLIDTYRPIFQIEIMESTLKKRASPQDFFDFFVRDRGYVACNNRRRNMEHTWRYVKGLADIFFIPKEKAKYIYTMENVFDEQL